MIAAHDALQRLRDGNRRFVSNVRSHDSLAGEARRVEVAAGQEPFAIILGCSDSRVPAEIVFDQGLGDLFVIRVAGNIVAPSQVGSVEFAAERYGTRLVVVLGHSQCGAILATIDELKRPTDQPVPESAFDRRPRAAVGRTAAADGARTGSRRARARCRTRERPHLGEPSTAWVRHPRAAHRGGRPRRRWCRVLARNRPGGLLRWRARRPCRIRMI